MNRIASRLIIERKKTGLSQKEFSSKANVTAKTQMLYESGRRVPDAVYLNLISQLGVDILFVVTGTRCEEFLSPVEASLIRNSRFLDETVYRALLEFVAKLR